MTIPLGQTLDLSTAGASYNLNGGTLQVGNGDLVGSTGQGKLNFNGGILQASSDLTDALDSVSTSTGTSTLLYHQR